jgi:hypothetical protein
MTECTDKKLLFCLIINKPSEGKIKQIRNPTQPNLWHVDAKKMKYKQTHKQELTFQGEMAKPLV